MGQNSEDQERMRQQQEMKNSILSQVLDQQARARRKYSCCDFADVAVVMSCYRCSCCDVTNLALYREVIRSFVYLNVNLFYSLYMTFICYRPYWEDE